MIASADTWKSPRLDRARIVTLIGTVGTLAWLRAVLGMPAPVASLGAGTCFALLLLCSAWAAGWRPSVPAVSGLAAGITSGLVLVAFAVARVGTVYFAVAPRSALLPWMAVVTLIASAEEIFIRGVLLDAVAAFRGDAVGVLVCAATFAAIHLPLYGLPAIPLDLAVGVFLGGLRLRFGLGAAIVAHCTADLMGGIAIL